MLLPANMSIKSKIRSLVLELTAYSSAGFPNVVLWAVLLCCLDLATGALGDSALRKSESAVLYYTQAVKTPTRAFR